MRSDSSTPRRSLARAVLCVCLALAAGSSGGHDTSRSPAAAGAPALSPAERAYLQERVEASFEDLVDLLSTVYGKPHEMRVLGLMTDLKHEERLWIRSSKLTEDGFVGVLLDKPARLSEYHVGAEYTVNHGDILDWVLKVPGKPARGSFEACWRARAVQPISADCQYAERWFAQKPFAPAR